MIGTKATQKGAVLAVLHIGTKILLSVEKYMLIHFQGKNVSYIPVEGKNTNSKWY